MQERWPFEVIVERKDGSGFQVNAWNAEAAETLFVLFRDREYGTITLIDVVAEEEARLGIQD